jgi:hypothetical protein
MQKHFWAILVVIFFVPSLSSVAQDLVNSRRNSFYTYIFRITDQEARNIYRKDLAVVTDDYFRVPIDSFPTDKVYTRKLPVGHYLFAYAEADQLVFELQSVNQLIVKILNNKTDLAVHVHDSLGTAVTTARLEVKGRRIPFDQSTQSYRLRKTNRRGLLAVTYQNTTSYHSIDAQYRTSRLKKTVYRVLFGIPLGYVSMPFRSLYYWVRYKSQPRIISKVIGLFDPDERETRRENRFERKHRGFVIFNKPKFMPGDTVKLKAVVLTRKGKPVNKEVILKFYGGEKTTTLTTLQPYRPGCFNYQFVLTDSLKARLDYTCQVSLENADDMTFVEGSFRYEDYELTSNTFKIRTERKEHYLGEKQALYAKGTDENDLNVLDAKVELTVTPDQVWNMKTNRVFVPDTLWHHQQTLEGMGETKIILPDSIFPKVSLGYTVEAVFLNANNERHVETLKLSYYYQAEELKISLKNDTLKAAYLKCGKSTPKRALLTAFNVRGDTLYSRLVSLPLQEKMNPYVGSYRVQADTLVQSLSLQQETAQLECLTNRTLDSVFITVQNPRNLPFWYTLYRKSTRIASGYDTRLSYEAKTTTPQNYFVSLQYIWNGQVQEEEYTVRNMV